MGRFAEQGEAGSADQCHEPVILMRPPAQWLQVPAQALEQGIARLAFGQGLVHGDFSFMLTTSGRQGGLSRSSKRA